MELCANVANGSHSQACEKFDSKRRWQVALISGEVVYNEVATQGMQFLGIEHVLLCMLQDPEQRHLGLLQMGGRRFVFFPYEFGCGRIGDSKEIVYPDEDGCIECQMVRGEEWKNENATRLCHAVRCQDLASVNRILRQGQDPNGDQTRQTFGLLGHETNPLEAAIQHGVSKTNLDIIRSLIAFGCKVEPMLRKVRDEKLLDVLLDYIRPLTKGSQLTDASKEAWVATLRSAIHGYRVIYKGIYKCPNKGILNLVLDKGPNVKDYLTADALWKVFVPTETSDEWEVGSSLLARLVQLSLPQASDHCLCKLMAKTIESRCEEGTALKAVEALINLTDLTCRLTDASKAAWVKNLQSTLFHGRKSVLNLLLDKGPDVKDYLTVDALWEVFESTASRDQWEVGSRLLARLVQLRLPQASEHCLCKLMAKTIETCSEEGPALKAVEALINLTDLTCPLTDASKAAWVKNLQSAVDHSHECVLNLLLDKGPNVKDYLTADAFWAVLRKDRRDEQWDRLRLHFSKFHRTSSPDGLWNVQDVKKLQTMANTCWEEQRKRRKRDELSAQLQNALCAFKALKPDSSIHRKFVDVQEKPHELLFFCWQTLASDKISQQRRESGSEIDFKKFKNDLKSQVKIHLAVFIDSIFHLDEQVQRSRLRTKKDRDKAATAAGQTDRFAEKLVEKIVDSMRIAGPAID